VEKVIRFSTTAPVKLRTNFTWPDHQPTETNVPLKCSHSGRLWRILLWLFVGGMANGNTVDWLSGGRIRRVI
jgi:hypothetical protein